MVIILFLIVLAVLILVHELGHFIAAKSAGIRVDEFGLGFPPRAVAWRPKKSETTYSLNWILFGGFVKIFGEDPEEAAVAGVDEKRSLTRKSRWIQIAVLAAGVLFNFLFAWVLISTGFLKGLPTSVAYSEPGLVEEPALTVIGLAPTSPAQEAGILGGDVILFAEGKTASLQEEELTVESFQNLVAESADEGVTLLLKRGGETRSVVVVPEQQEGSERPVIGVYLDLIGMLRLPFPRAFLEGAKLTGNLFVGVVQGLGMFIADAFAGDADLSQITGPVGIAGLVGDASRLGFIYLVSFTAFISLNLAVINLIPFPALDGGRILFVIIEAFKGSPISPRIARTLNTIGFTLLIALMLVVTYHDIMRLLGR